MRRLAKQFELGGQRRDTLIRLVTREVRLKCGVVVSGFRQRFSFAACSAVIGLIRSNSSIVRREETATFAERRGS
jgi:hypothetical protein